MPSAIPREVLEQPYVDYVARGYGEELIVEIAQMFEGKLQKDDIEGLSYKKDGEIIVGGFRRLSKDLDCYAADYSLVDLNNYIFDGRVLGLLMSSRGCPFNCAFCYNQFFAKRKWLKHSCAYVKETLGNLKSKYDFSVFSFSDDNFFVDRDRAFEILDVTSNLGLTVTSLDVKINNLKPGDAQLMQHKKVECVFFGTESLNGRIIQLVNKEQTKKMVRQTIRNFAEEAPGISLQTEILVGLPTETITEMKKDVSDGIALLALNPNFSIYFGNFMPLPETDLFSLAVQQNKGFAPQELEDYIEINIVNAANLVDKWAVLDNPTMDKRTLGCVERYASFLCLDRRKIDTLPQLIKYAFYKLACWRLTKWNFAFSSLDFSINKFCASFYRVIKKITPNR